jgi:hypothetical protein
MWIPSKFMWNHQSTVESLGEGKVLLWKWNFEENPDLDPVWLSELTNDDMITFKIIS